MDAKLSTLAISGCSAGSLGTQAWAAELLSELSYDEAAVVVDSYAGVFPNGTQGPLIVDYGMCGVRARWHVVRGSREGARGAPTPRSVLVQ